MYVCVYIYIYIYVCIYIYIYIYVYMADSKTVFSEMRPERKTEESKRYDSKELRGSIEENIGVP